MELGRESPTSGYTQIAADISARSWPTVVVLEGGYLTDALGKNVAAFLTGFP